MPIVPYKKHNCMYVISVATLCYSSTDTSWVWHLCFCQQCLGDCGYFNLSSFLNVLKISLLCAFSLSFAEWKPSFTLNPWWTRKPLLRTTKLKPAMWVSQTWLILLKPYWKYTMIEEIYYLLLYMISMCSF